MDPFSLSTAYQSLKAAKEILVTLYDAKVDASAKQKLMEVQTKLGEVHDELFVLRERLDTLQNERDGLRQELTKAESWATKAEQYELTKTFGNAVVYKFKSQPDHLACPSCFNKREIHILQDRKVESGDYMCTGCREIFKVD